MHTHTDTPAIKAKTQQSQCKGKCNERSYLKKWGAVV